jgi:hypothetical protein
MSKDLYLFSKESFVYKTFIREEEYNLHDIIAVDNVLFFTYNKNIYAFKNIYTKEE